MLMSPSKWRGLSFLPTKQETNYSPHSTIAAANLTFAGFSSPEGSLAVISTRSLLISSPSVI
jgi:hypothetical protein